MKKLIVLISIFSLLILAGCANEDPLDNGKPPKVTIDKDGNYHIDRLDPGESVILEFELIIPREETKDDKKTATDKFI